MISSNPISAPAQNSDGTISAVIQDIQPLPHRGASQQGGALLRLWLPVPIHEGAGFGRFYMVRCTDDTLQARATEWSIYGRRALFCAAMPTAMPDQAGSSWLFAFPHHHDHKDPGYQWLLRRPLDSTLNLLGPFGQPFDLAAHTRTLLAITDLDSLPLILPIVHTMLDRGGRVTLLVKGQAEHAAPLLPLIPIPVEVRFVPADDWLAHLAEGVRWADQLCAVLPNHDYAPLAHQIRTLRFQLDQAFANVLVRSDLLCGVGACLTCVVSPKDGSYTRACMHGPVFPLTTLAP
jgi:hypothetical protein